MRRFLRIFPLFYAVLLVTEFLRFPPVRASFWWNFTYLSNIYLFRLGSAFDSITHLWSLAVEEQFYVIWPWLILYLPWPFILPMVLVSIATGPVFRAGILWGGANAWQASILTPACLDALGLGALLAILSAGKSTPTKSRVMRTCAFSGLVVFIVAVIGGIVHPSDWWVVAFDFGIALWAVALIDRAYSGFSGIVGSLLSFAPIAYLGLISYGIYVMHNFVGGVAVRVLGAVGVHHPSQFARAVCMAAITIALATASWQFFEKPINRMKRFFPYRVG
jgi:peptidoglycan/LPS O-acetylase OafA/YrhL